LILWKGTAGVWRIRSIHEAGGWADRTTVEDMDLAVRAGLSGWKFVYLGDVKVYFFLHLSSKFYTYQNSILNSEVLSLIICKYLTIIKQWGAWK
jgi:hypothetical protein